FHPFHPERRRQPRKGASSASSGHGKPGNASFQAISYTPLRLPPSFLRPVCLPAAAPYPVRRGQRRNPPHHASKEPPVQMSLGQQQPVVPGVLDQSPASLHE